MRSPQQAAGPRRQRRGPAPLLVWLSVLLVLAGSGILVWNHVQERDLPRDLAGNPVRLEEGDTPAPDVVVAMDVRSGGGSRLSVPSVHLDVPLDSLDAVDGEVTPPGFSEAYLIRNMGVDLEHRQDGTVYVVTHSVRHGDAPGNSLIDVEKGSSQVQAGDTIQVGDATYVAERSLTVAKGDLASAPGIWDDEPGRLVLITCLQRESGRSLQNVVVIARQVAA